MRKILISILLAVLAFQTHKYMRAESDKLCDNEATYDKKYCGER